MTEQRFNVIPCTNCGQRYAGAGHITFDDKGQAAGAVCPPCANNTPQQVEQDEPVTSASPQPTSDEAKLDLTDAAHDGLTLLEVLGDDQTVVDVLKNKTRRELQAIITVLLSLVDKRPSLLSEIADTNKWAHELRKHYVASLEKE